MVLVLKRILLVVVLLCPYLLTRANFVIAGGYEVSGFGAKAMSLGGAFVGLADNWTASYYNPAGLARLKGKNIGITLFNVNWNGWDRDSLPNVDPAILKDKKSAIRQGYIFPRVYPSEPPQFSKKEIFHRFNQPSIGGYFGWKGFTIGLATYNPLGNYLRWRDIVKDPSTQANILASYYARFFMTVSNLSLAKKITPKLSLGMGVNLVYSQLELDAYKRYQNAKSSALQPDYNLDIEDNGKGIGWEGVVGLLYEVSPQFSIGAVYRSGSTVRMHGSGHIYQTVGEEGVLAEGSDYLRKFPQPPTWTIGLAYKPTPPFTFVADWHGTDWRVQKYHINYDEPGDNLTNTNINLHWKVSFRYRFGLEYQINPELAFRAGYYFDERALPGEMLGFTTVATANRHEATVGLAYHLGKWILEATYTPNWGKESNGGVGGVWSNNFHFSLAFQF